MNPISIEEIVIATNGELIKGNGKDLVNNISIDSRKTKKKDMYIALIGEKFDGHDFIKDAYEKGANTFVIDKNHHIDLISEDINIIKVEDTTKAIGDIAKFYRDKFKIHYVGVTGSTGKTTTKDMIYAVLSSKYKTLKTEGNFNNHIGLPLTIFNLESYHEAAILEMGMSSFGEIEYLAEIARPHIAVISNIGFSHIENLGSREGILKAKLEITSQFSKDNILIINGDDEYLKTVKNKKVDYKIKSFGFNFDNDLKCIKYETNEDGTQFTVELYNKEYDFFTPARGKHNIYNAMAAILVGMELNLSIEEIKKGLLDYKATNMRLDIIKKGNIIIINDAYNASPDSMKAALDVLNEYKNNRKIAVLGDMLEMGEYSKQVHEIVGSFAKDKSDIIITVGNNSRYIGYKAIEEGFEKSNVYHFSTNEEVVELLEKIISDDDVVLVKGSRGMRMEKIVEALC
ncbi:UDP-N-acetylmuramoyl-tripeptide--D-alanyl-D-alanine ligase [Alkalithermobacter thermoalcaliphilus JW-YL-7 = DSM 7308]|uniref:UDP-N-acetylmuramoyl-tripeptide--D-alanyl-D-alanine ligase n=1 Tax=Alkalithermobacter thermoalcaliphilus JW-YL-7 = DSM 7308 TaxID=1121328 RepID=A0A150FPP8_CLOPD|nr:UDP-N-acetylmuramoylalanyl-D-glutamyl-2,6-diaminopimelate/D-alanyl-D-alanyl ligase [[Clostridium] paradoxum JW-YL-7 = DSM 7308]SHK98636.1 UDP-N-acetylmuramoyl-tripeptide--D-alanyl-D-alanine ligase [[Clostridium] paradoxum JW-YL-7 = DSM 7308]